MPLVSVLTPTQAQDGQRPVVREQLPDDPRIRYDALGAQIGGAATRNTALARARGDLIAGMDHDDWYEPGGLAALVEPLADDPTVAWSCARTRWHNPDGTSWVKPDVYPPGRIEPGTIAATYRRWPAQHTVQPADIAIRDLPHVRGFIAQRLAAERTLTHMGQLDLPTTEPPMPDRVDEDHGAGG